jgi:cation:H+ antiporter
MYAGFVVHTIYHSNKAGKSSEEYEYEEVGSETTAQALQNWDINYLVFGDKEFTTKSAWVVAGFATIMIGIACHYLAASVEGVATSIGLPAYLVALTLGAAATSVPDCIMSVKEAQRGQYSSAVNNVTGSNLFDILVVVFLPVLGWILYTGEPLGIVQSDNMTVVRMFVMTVTAGVVASLVLMSNKITRITAGILLSLYAVWMTWVSLTAFGISIF